MPRYDFRCTECKSESIVHMKISEYTPKVYCTFCKGFTLKRIFSATPVQFKGSGWGGTHPTGD